LPFVKVNQPPVTKKVETGLLKYKAT